MCEGTGLVRAGASYGTCQHLVIRCSSGFQSVGQRLNDRLLLCDVNAWQWALIAAGVLVAAYLTAVVQRAKGQGFARSFIMAVIGYGGLVAFILNIILNS